MTSFFYARYGRRDDIPPARQVPFFITPPSYPCRKVV